LATIYGFSFAWNLMDWQCAFVRTLPAPHYVLRARREKGTLSTFFCFRLPQVLISKPRAFDTLRGFFISIGSSRTQRCCDPGSRCGLQDGDSGCFMSLDSGPALILSKTF